MPLSPGHTGMTVEGIWQGLKVFESADIDLSKLGIATMRGIKRSARRHGKVLGHRAGIGGESLLPYAEARRLIYLPAYRWMLLHKVPDLVAELRRLAQGDNTVILLDYETNGDPDNLARPLSHAALIVPHLEGHWPTEGIDESPKTTRRPLT